MATKKKDAKVKPVAVKKVSLKSGSNREDLYEVGKNKPPKDKQFSSENQPAPGVLKAAHAKKRFSREVIKTMLDGKYDFAPDSQTKQQLIKAFGPDVVNLTVGEIMTLQQMQKSILKADTQAFATIIDQALGKQVQAVQNVDGDGNDQRPIYLVAPKGMKFELPSNTEGTGDEDEGETE